MFETTVFSEHNAFQELLLSLSVMHPRALKHWLIQLVVHGARGPFPHAQTHILMRSRDKCTHYLSVPQHIEADFVLTGDFRASES